MDDNSVAALALLLIFGLPVGGWIISRIMAHRERMAMLRSGFVPPDRRTMRAWRRAQRHGGWSAWSGQYGAPPPWVNGAAAPGPGPGWIPSQPVPDDPDDAQCMLRSGIKTTMVGFALLIGLGFIGYRSGPLGIPTIEPGPWLLGGLIPMFVGIAQIVIAVMSGAQIGRAPAPPPNVAPGPAPGPGTAGGAGPAGPVYPGYPGEPYERLARPVPPPDQR